MHLVDLDDCVSDVLQRDFAVAIHVQHFERLVDFIGRKEAHQILREDVVPAVVTVSRDSLQYCEYDNGGD